MGEERKREDEERTKEENSKGENENDFGNRRGGGYEEATGVGEEGKEACKERGGDRGGGVPVGSYLRVEREWHPEEEGLLSGFLERGDVVHGASADMEYVLP